MYIIPPAKVMQDKVHRVLNDEDSVARLSEFHLKEIAEFINIHSQEGSSRYEHRFVIVDGSLLTRQILSFVENELKEQGYETRLYYELGHRIKIKW